MARATAAFSALQPAWGWMVEVLFRPVSFSTWAWLICLLFVVSFTPLGGGVTLTPLHFLPLETEQQKAFEPWEQLRDKMALRYAMGQMDQYLLVALFVAAVLVVFLVLASTVGALAHGCIIDRLVWGRRPLGELLRRYAGMAARLGLGLSGWLILALGGALLVLLLVSAVLAVVMQEDNPATAVIVAGVSFLIVMVVLLVIGGSLFVFNAFVLPWMVAQGKGFWSGVAFALRTWFGAPLACLLYLAASVVLQALTFFPACIALFPFMTANAIVMELLFDAPFEQLAPDDQLLALLVATVMWLISLPVMLVLYTPFAVYKRCWNLAFLSAVSPSFAGINPWQRRMDAAQAASAVESAPPPPAPPTAIYAPPPPPLIQDQDPPPSDSPPSPQS